MKPASGLFIIRMKKLSLLIFFITIIGFLFISCKSGNSFEEVSNEKVVGISWLQGKWKGEMFYHGIEKSEPVFISIENNEALLKIGNKLCKEKYIIETGDNKYQMIKFISDNSVKCIFPRSFSIMPTINGDLITLSENIREDLTNVNSIYVQFPKGQLRKEASSGFLDKEVKKWTSIEKMDTHNYNNWNYGY